MSGNSTVSGTTVVSQFTGATPGSSAALALQQLGGLAFSADSVDGAYTASGAVSLGTGITSATITSATVVVSNAPNANITVTTLPSAEVFAAPGDTITATGADTLFGASTGTTSFMCSGANSSIVGSTGSMAVTSSGANTTLIGGTGTNNFTVSGAGSDAVAGPAPGVTDVTLTDTGGAQISTNPNGGSGTLIATLSATGADSVIGGGGASTITAGGGSDVFGFVNGHAGGSEVIIGFNSADNFAFGGYGYSATNAPTESYDTPGATGSDVITLTDGTTITLVGIDHKVF
jgi:serralysin